MTHREFIRHVQALPAVREAIARRDKAAAREAFAHKLDAAHKRGEISQKQVDTWQYPRSWD